MWCGHEVTYRPANKASLTRAKSRMATHELSCEASPVVRENNKLRAINRQLTAIFQLKKGAPTLLECYLNPRRKSAPNILLDEFAELARATAAEDDVLAYLRRDVPELCAVCGDASRPAVGLRMIAPTLTHVALMCQSCIPNQTKVKEAIDGLTEVGETGLLEMAFLWKEGKRTRMLWGDKLHVETIR